MSGGSAVINRWDIFELLGEDCLVGFEPGWSVAFAATEVAVEGDLAAVERVVQMGTVEGDDAGAVAFRAIDFIACTGNGLAFDLEKSGARAYVAADGGLGSNGDEVALHAKCVPVRSKGRTLEEPVPELNQTFRCLV